jgi:hypothetical protein
MARARFEAAVRRVREDMAATPGVRIAAIAVGRRIRYTAGGYDGQRPPDWRSTAWYRPGAC